MSKIPWEKIRAEYVAGGISQRALAKKYNVGQGTLAQRSRREGWVADRDQVNSKAVAKANQRVADKKAEALAALAETYDSMTVSLAKMAADLQTQKLEGVKGVQVLEGMARTLSVMTSTAHTLYHKPTVSEEVAADRLRLERERFEDDKKNRKESSQGTRIEWILTTDAGDGIPPLDE